MLIRTSPKIYDLYVNKRNNWVDMEVMSWSQLGYEKFINTVWPDFATAKVPELILSEKLSKASTIKELIIKDQFLWTPFIIGRRGTDGGSFQSNLRRYYIHIKTLKNIILFSWIYIKNNTKDLIHSNADRRM